MEGGGPKILVLGQNFGWCCCDYNRKELGMMRRDQRHFEINEMELNLYQSGSVPPKVEASLVAMGGLFNCNGVSGSTTFENVRYH